VGPRNSVLDGVKIGQIHLQPRGVTNRRCGLLQNYKVLKNVFYLEGNDKIVL